MHKYGIIINIYEIIGYVYMYILEEVKTLNVLSLFHTFFSPSNNF